MPRLGEAGSLTFIATSGSSHVPAVFGYQSSNPQYSAVAYGSYLPPTTSLRLQQRRQQQGSSSVMNSHSNSLSPGGVGSSDLLSRTNLYIRGLEPTTKDSDLFNMCQSYGKIVSTKAIIDPTSGSCKGYGFVDFETEQAAEEAVRALKANGMQAQMARQQERDDSNLYIANLPATFNEQDLEDMCAQYGQVISTRILRATNGLSRGVGFVRMESKSKCEALVDAFNGKMLPRQTEPLTVKFADAGNKKRYPRRQWVDRGINEIASPTLSEHNPPQNGSTFVPQPTTYIPNQPMISPGYPVLAPVAPTPVQPIVAQYPPMAVQPSWYHNPAAVAASPTPHYILTHNPYGPVVPGVHPYMQFIDPNLLATQMNQLQLQPIANTSSTSTAAADNSGSGGGM
jgi:RNA recognition motif-containing protein